MYRTRGREIEDHSRNKKKKAKKERTKISHKKSREIVNIKTF